jgi:hypothetical protein
MVWHNHTVRHRMHTGNYNTLRLIRVANLLLASFGVSTSLMAAANAGYHFSTWNIVLGSIDLVWLFGALCLFFRWRAGWIASLVGAGTSAFVDGSIFFDPSGWPTLEQMHQQHSLIIFIFAFVFTVGLFLAFTAVYLGLFFGLVRKRKELI